MGGWETSCTLEKGGWVGGRGRYVPYLLAETAWKRVMAGESCVPRMMLLPRVGGWVGG